MATNHPIFIYRYLDRTTPRTDSVRFRNRASAAFSNHFNSSYYAMSNELKARAGIRLHDRSGSEWYDWELFWTKAPFEEVLSAITIIFHAAAVGSHDPRSALGFRADIAAALSDENLGFRIDEKGVIHFAVDEDFTMVESTTLAGLSDKRLATAKAAYEQAQRFMVGNPPNTLLAIKSAFEAVEVLATQLIPAHKNLHHNLCRNELKNLCVPVLTKDQTETEALEGQFDGMADWVNSIHFYRHRKWHTAEPSVDTAVFALTTASAYLRLLARVAVQVLPK